MASNEDLTLTQGTDARFKINIKDENGDVKDLSGKSFIGGLKKSYTDSTTISFSTAVVNADAGEIRISLDNDQTAELDSSTRYVYDVFMYDSGNTNVTEVVSGKVFVVPSVSRVG